MSRLGLLLPDWAASLEEELIRRSIFSTAAIEGNPLQEEEVGRIIEQKHSEAKHDEAKQAIINLIKVYNYIKTIKPIVEHYRLTEKFIKDVHKIITLNLLNPDNTPGNYRDHIVKVGDREHGGIYTPPKCRVDIENLMKEFIEWINSEEVMQLDRFIRAALAHYHLGLIHPFGNGNGRTIRIIEAMLLRVSGIKYVPTMLSNYYYRQIDDYYIAFSQTQKNREEDMTEFIKFALKGVIESLKEIKGRITSNIRLLVTRDYLHFLREKKRITQRQFDLIYILMGDGGFNPISLKDLFNKSPYNTLYRHVSERTARRDIAKLLELNILTHENDHYILDIHALG